MKGQNRLRLNGATMQEIVQVWLDREMTDAPKVTDVRHIIETGAPVFEVILSGREDGEKTDGR